MQDRNRSKFQKFALFVLSFFVMFLAACTTGALSIDVEVTLYKDEKWQAESLIIYSSQQIQLMGSQIDQGMSQLMSEWQAQGMRASMNQEMLDNGNWLYTITASGQSYHQLNTAFFDGMATINHIPDSDPPQIDFSYVPVGSFFSLAISRKFTLNGGEILSSNGTQIDKDTVTWFNPINTMQATLTPKVSLDLRLVLYIFGGLLVLIILVSIARKAGRKRCWNCGAIVPRNADFCTECGVEV